MDEIHTTIEVLPAGSGGETQYSKDGVADWIKLALLFTDLHLLEMLSQRYTVYSTALTGIWKLFSSMMER